MKGFVTPRGFLLRAIWISVAFAVVHLLGFREHTRFLSGTPSNPVLGEIYLMVYGAFVLLAPPLLVGAGVFALLQRVFGSPEEVPPRV